MSERNRGQQLREILDRLKALEGVRSDVELAEPLITNRRNIAAWKERGSLPWERLDDYCSRKHISLEWLLNGRGPTRLARLVAEPGAVYQVATHQDVLYRLAGDVYRAVGETGLAISPEKFAGIMHLLHRDMLDAGVDEVSYEKVLKVVRLAG